MGLEKIIEEYLVEYKDEIISSLCEFVRIPSVLEDATEVYPYGRECARALDFCKNLCEVKNLRAHNDNYVYVEARLNEEVKGKRILFAAHADIVPASDGNIYKPYGGEIIGDYIVGRGVVDNKGPLIAVLYALAFFKKNNIKLNNDIRLFMGANEEVGMDDLEYYLKKNGQPDFGLAVDDDFPVVNGEKGLIKFILSGEKSNCIKEAVSYGKPQRVINDICRIVTDNHVYEDKSSNNPVQSLISTLNKNGVHILNDRERNKFLVDLIEDSNGNIIESYGKDEISGETSVKIYKVSTKDNEISFYFDMRLPVSLDHDKVIKSLEKLSEEYGLKVSIIKNSKSYFIPENDPVVSMLTNLYNKHSNSHDKPYVMSACTYARLFEKGCGFGAGNPHEVKPFPKGHGAAHGPDEAHSIEVLMHAIKIYILGIYELDRYFSKTIGK